MAWFKRKHQEDDDLTSKNHDFASMVKNARDTDPGRFKRVQEAFKKSRHQKTDKPKR